MNVKTIAGATVSIKVEAIDNLTGATKDMSTWTVTATWVVGVSGPATPPVPVCVPLTTTSWGVTASTTGLGGRAVPLRIVAVDPNSSTTLKIDVHYVIEA